MRKSGSAMNVALAVFLMLGSSRIEHCMGFTATVIKTPMSSSLPTTTTTVFAKRLATDATNTRPRETAAAAAATESSSATKSTSNPSGPLYVSLSTPSRDDAEASSTSWLSSFVDELLEGSYLGPRIVLAVLACFYATNFPLGTIMADAFPSPSAVTSARMLLAALALSPQILKIEPTLRIPAMITGCFTALGYIAQSSSLALDTSPATVSFLGTATVLVCPFLEWAVDKKPMSLREAPQTWLAALLCLSGVAMLELWDPTTAAVGGFSWGSTSSGNIIIGLGDGLALVQAIGFGTQVYLCEKMVSERPDQTLPVTATLIATTALISAVWSLADGWMFQPGGMAFTIPQVFFFEPSSSSFQPVMALCILWTGLVSTGLSLFLEMSALARVSSAEASVLLATEPMWAAVFASLWLGETFGVNDVMGGTLMILACLANTSLKPSDFEFLFGRTEGEGEANTKNYSEDVFASSQEQEEQLSFSIKAEESEKEKKFLSAPTALLQQFLQRW